MEFKIIKNINEDIILICKFTNQEYDIEAINDVVGYIKIEGVYYSAPPEKDKDGAIFPLNVENEKLKNFIKEKQPIIFKNKKELENIMSNKKVPYQMWAITALKNELKARKFNSDDYKDIKDKAILVEMLKQDDDANNSGIKEPEDAPEPKKEKVEKPKAEKPKAEKPKVEKPKVEKPKVEKPKRKVSLNEELKKAGLWVKGAQFLKSIEKQALLEAKTEKDRKAIYDKLEKKNKDISGKLSVAISKSIKERSAGDTEKQSNPFEGKTLKELQKIAIKNKDIMKEKGYAPKKNDTEKQLIEKLIKSGIK